MFLYTSVCVYASMHIIAGVFLYYITHYGQKSQLHFHVSKRKVNSAFLEIRNLNLLYSLSLVMMVT